MLGILDSGYRPKASSHNCGAHLSGRVLTMKWLARQIAVGVSTEAWAQEDVVN